MPARLRPTTHLVLATLGLLWFGAVAGSVHYRDLTWLQYLFVDVTWIQALLLIAGGYGAFLVLVGALIRVRPASPLRAGLPFVSVVVPAKNEEAVIEATVRSLWAMDYAEDGERRFEVIVVDDRSTDGTARILNRLAREWAIRVVQTPAGSFGKAAALNYGIAHSRADVIAVFDADARVGPDFLRLMVPFLAGPGVGGVQSRRVLYNAGQNAVTRLQDDEYRLFQDTLQRARRWLGGMVCVAGNGLLLRREALDEVGGWNEDALTEDIDLSVRFHLAGWEIRYCNEAIVWEEAVVHLRPLMRQRVRWFEGAFRCLGDHLPGILFGRIPLFKRIDMLFFLGGALMATTALLTIYFYALVDLAGAVVLYLQLPLRITTVGSAAITAALTVGLLAEYRSRLPAAALAMARNAGFSVVRLVIMPLAVVRYVRSAITGETSWEKTAHGASEDARVWTLHAGTSPKDKS
jgi:1,2-diacylglycerol 3-beta-glucosyltransferase